LRSRLPGALSRFEIAHFQDSRRAPAPALETRVYDGAATRDDPAIEEDSRMGPAAQLLRHPLRTLGIVRNFIKTVDDPTRSDIQHGINRLIRDAVSGATDEEIAAARDAQPELARLYAEGYDPKLDADALAALPAGTLGHEYARFIRENEIDPLGTLIALGPPRNFLEYSILRAYKLHDILHVVLGCDATVMGEVRIVSFSLGQGRNDRPRAPAAALSVLLLHLTIKDPRRMREAVSLAARWLDLGSRVPPHTSVRIEDWMDRPVEEVRERVLGAENRNLAA
jgi:ubiquinone biosynthesis protein Coq4